MAEFISFQPSDFFNVVLYTGNATADRQITLGFQPDMAWAKSRTNTENHALFDSVRGGYRIMPDQDNAQDANTGVTAWNSTGYVIGSSDSFNSNSQSFVNWAWKMGTTSGLSGGTITPSGYSISTTAGQSIIAYTGTGSAGTIPHGLGKTPDMIMVKETSNATDWAVYTTIVGKSNFLKLNKDDSEASTSNWNSTLPTSSLFSIGAGGQVNTSGRTYVAYCFANIPGYSKAGSYVGTGNADGVFVYTGFRPAMVIVKDTNNNEDWWMVDYKRSAYNLTDKIITPDQNIAEVQDTGYFGDMVSNGFKMKSTNVSFNASGNYFTYLAFAEFPLVSSNDVPTVAR
jgi:hypothetical protein